MHDTAQHDTTPQSIAHIIDSTAVHSTPPTRTHNTFNKNTLDFKKKERKGKYGWMVKGHHRGKWKRKKKRRDDKKDI